MDNEIWKDIEEFNNSYQVSNFGSIRSKERYINTRTYPSQIMKTFVGNNKSIMVRLRNGKSQVTRSVAKLVLITFEGKPPKNAKQVKHLDGNPNNNRLNNLEWDVDKAYGLPPNLKARELFNEEADRMVDIFIRKYSLQNISFGEADIEDFKQECLIAIWNVIDILENPDNKSFYAFIHKKCSWVFQRFYSKYKNRHRYVYFSQLCSEDNEDYFLETFQYNNYWRAENA